MERQRIETFKVNKINYLEKLKCKIYQFEHSIIKSKYIHIENQDDNNCFAVGFKTIPKDSKGIAHILEHTVLCGSEKFPVRDPFFSMIRRSMKTFMNAFTASDWTMYPVCSQNKKDLYNLVDVYLDAIFFPLLTKESFLQEGHRLEFKEIDNPNSELIIKGVVYNEMKGAMSTQSSIMHRRVGQALYPTITYKYNSGGEPSDIPDLIWEELKKFHQTHYHPCNAWFYTYGDLPVEEHLKMMEEKVFAKFEVNDTNTKVANEVRREKPKNFTFKYPLNREDNDGKKCQLALVWLACDVKEPLEVLSLQLISQILLGSAAAPLRKALLESKLGKAMSDITGFEDELKETYFGVGLQEVAESDAQNIEDLILKTLKSIVENGINPILIESAIQQMELDIREISGGQFPYALILLFRFFCSWIHGGDPMDSLDFDENIRHLSQKIDHGPYLEKQIQKYLIENQHRVRVLLKPDENLEAAQTKEETNKIKKISEKFTNEKKANIIDISLKLKSFQEKEENLGVLPRLEIVDIPKKNRVIEEPKVYDQPLKTAFYPQPTNGIVYYHWYFTVDEISEEERKLLPFFTYLFPKCGTKEKTYEAFSIQVNRFTGGIGFSPNYFHICGDHQYIDTIGLSSKTLSKNQENMIDLVEQISSGWNFSDLERVDSLLKQKSNALLNTINESGHTYAATLAKRGFSFGSLLDETYGGVSNVQTARKLSQYGKKELKKLIFQLNQFGRKIIRSGATHALVVGQNENMDMALKCIQRYQLSLNNEKMNLPAYKKSHQEIQYRNELWLTSTPVNHVARCFKTESYEDTSSPRLLVLSNLLQSIYLHTELREKGGAYGGMAAFNAEEGIFTLLSYRDPHLSKTMNVFEDAINWILDGKFSDQDVEEAILQTCSKLDTPYSPAGKALRDFINRLKNKSMEKRNRFRKQILSCAKQDLIQVAEKWLTKSSSIVSLTNEEQYKNENSYFRKHPFEVNRI